MRHRLGPLALALALTNVSCARHPTATVAIAAGGVALLTCEVNNASFWDSHDAKYVQGTCGIITAGVALVLGGLTALVTAFADTSAHEIPPDEEITPEGTVRLHTHTALPPVPMEDAGVPLPDGAGAPAPDAALPASAPASDAGVADAAS
jgi:hypothetical protein